MTNLNQNSIQVPNLYIYQNEQGNALAFNENVYFILKSDPNLMDWTVPIHPDNELVAFVLRNTQDALQAAYVLSKVWNYQVVSIPSNLSSERTDEEVKEFCKKYYSLKYYAQQTYNLKKDNIIDGLVYNPQGNNLFNDNFSLDLVNNFSIRLISTEKLLENLEPISGKYKDKILGTLREEETLDCVYVNNEIHLAINEFYIKITESTIRLYRGVLYEEHKWDIKPINLLLLNCRH